jgi:hypothetical protein
MIFERYSKYVKKFQGMSPHQILPSLNIKWGMTTAKTDTMEEDVVKYIKDTTKFLTTFLEFPEDIELNLDKIICFYISNPQISDDVICCFAYTTETLDDLLDKMERIVNIKAFI